jgi:hypothetical protein
MRSHRAHYENRNDGVRSVCQLPLRPFVKKIICARRVTLKGQHQAQLFAEPLQSLITIDCDRGRHNIMVIKLVKAIAHQTNRILFEEQVDWVIVIVCSFIAKLAIYLLASHHIIGASAAKRTIGIQMNHAAPAYSPLRTL